MKLCVVGRQDIDKLEEITRSLFSSVEDKNVVVPDLNEPVPAYDARNLGQVFRFIPVKDKDILSLVWYLPSTYKEYKTQPLRYHSHLFGHEGENSLLSYLISEGLALELSSSHDHELNGAFSNFNVDISLTKKGLENYEQVIASVFQYARLVRDRGVQDYVFQETKRVGELEFDFLDKSKALNYSSRLASKMQQFDGAEGSVEDIIRHMYIVEDFDKGRIQEMSEKLTDARHINIYLRSKTFTDQQCTIVDPWYATRYSKEKFTERILSLINSPNVPQTK